MTAYYNDNDPFAGAWLRALIAHGQIACGDVDDRSITDVKASDLAGYRQCHFFAGIGGWSLALRLASWPDDWSVWTASIPCQPLSSAGQHRGHADKRHLWPAFFELLAERAPSVVFGEQVSGAAGREWYAGIRADLEAIGYASGAADLPAASVGAPHYRPRIYWMAYTDRDRRQELGAPRLHDNGKSGNDAPRSSAPDDLADPGGHGWQQGGASSAQAGQPEPARPSAFNFWSDFGLVYESNGAALRIESGIEPLAHGIPSRVGRLRGYGNAIVPPLAAEFIKASMETLRDASATSRGQQILHDQDNRDRRNHRRRELRRERRTGMRDMFAGL